MNKRESVQKEAVGAFLESNKKSIIKAAPRTGKIRIALGILEREGARNVLIAYPRKDIQIGWEEEMRLLKFDREFCNVRFVTFRSLNKVIIDYDYFIIDEIHEASDLQLCMMEGMIGQSPTIALTGTMTKKTERNINVTTGLQTCFNYSIEEAVRDGVLCDYSISVYYIPLDDKIVKFESKKGKKYTEKSWFRTNQWLSNNVGGAMFEHKLLHIIQGSYSKLQKTKELLEQFKDERVLVFCGLMEIADQLGIPVYHSGNKDEDVFIKFCNGEGDKLATIKMMQAGITIKPIHKGIINYTSGNPEDAAQKICRFLGMEYDNIDKKADLHILCSEEKFERDRMKTALAFFDETKIKYYGN